MAIVNTLVAKSVDTKAAALNLNAKANEVRQTIAGVWDLKPSSTTPPESAFNLDMKNDSTESVVEGDERVKVQERDFQAGGKYRSIVKLFIRYEFSKPDQWACGTGWLIRPDVMVTAGHCTYDWGHSLGRAVEVKAYIGYKGRGFINDPSVQFRTAKRIVTTEGWLKTRGAKSFDVGFIQVDKPFTGIVPIKFAETPAKGELVLGVVGYPADLKDQSTGEKGAHMYEMFLHTSYDLATQTDTMIEYQIDTYGGNSGSPVFRQSDMTSIGAHVYGGTINSASVIGTYGNPYNDYLSAFNLSISKDGLNLLPISGGAGSNCPNCRSQLICPSCAKNGTTTTQTKGSTLAPAPVFAQKTTTYNQNGFKNTNGYQQTGFQQAQSLAQRNGTQSVRAGQPGQTMDEEGFFEFMKSVVRIGAPIVGGALSAGLPIALGPLGGPVAALAGTALNAAAKLAEAGEAEAGDLDAATLHEGTVERAVLAEAALTAITTLNLHPDEEESIFSDMRDYIAKAAPIVRKVAPKIMGAMMEPALRMAVDSLHTYNQNQTAGSKTEGFYDLEATKVHLAVPVYSARIEQPADHNTEAFLAGIQGALQHGAEAYGDEEGFLDFIKAGARIAGQGLSFAAKTGLPLLAQVLRTESDIEQPDVNAIESSAATSAGLSADDLAKRAVAAEAALQALMKMDPHRLQEEGFFENIASVVKKIAPIVGRVAPAVIGNTYPKVAGLIKAVTGQESSFISNGKAARGLQVRKQPSMRGLRKQPSNNDFLSRVKEFHDANPQANKGRANNQEFGFSFGPLSVDF